MWHDLQKNYRLFEGAGIGEAKQTEETVLSPDWQDVLQEAF